ncbi:putative 2-aminoethylphosphonate ABC transporter ATP-binding protein [Photobacterium sp. 2_MG-2023]|uniref:putative 2-aminoethylphosphonate ABC transporter ATP-binding protein n=1 Tax=unclassified Photobacterium TaxID=2628852 RepID=UPI001C45ABEB|nr:MULTISPECIES: putative 2-aminoethylphosphonate ABC transporter ATP-binding protein [unclassified Photobacterium]MBV7263306.1 putative 2-aminoethylphosphonate ABC transporter ATP-binding protein [Photobacterium sp. WH24]MDO6582378.1 putative 2-aminoethylphosphonate ABC transporter ATP-binding protein [Photobacterium sp. 2_MG-2023]
METYLKISQVGKQFGQFTALNNISLDINKGEFICFLGPSGCGKTTLLRAIAGLDLASSGTIEQAGRDITYLPPEKRDFGIVFQSYALFPNLTVYENLSLGLRNQGKSVAETDSIVSQWLETIALPTAGNKYPSQLSGGQQQRVALARALSLSPGLLLLDEPLSALDAKVRSHLREEIRRLQRKLGITTIMVTHDQEEALAMADRIVVMNHGCIEQVGTPQEIYQNPSSRFVAEFVGQMNFLPASVVSEQQMRIGESLLPLPAAQFQRGEQVELGLRPEDLHFLPAGEKSDSSVLVRIDELEFQGTFMRADCQLQGAHQLPTIKVDVPIRETRNLGLSRGHYLQLHIADKHTHIYRQSR